MKRPNDKLEHLNDKINKLQYQELKQAKEEIKKSDSDEDSEVGPKFEEGGQEFLNATMNLIKKPSETDRPAPSKELEDELSRMFSSAAKKRVKGPQLPADQELDTKKYLGVVDKKLTEEEEDQRQAAIKDYMNEYNTHFRQKTLLEEH